MQFAIGNYTLTIIGMPNMVVTVYNLSNELI